MSRTYTDRRVYTDQEYHEMKESLLTEIRKIKNELNIVRNRNDRLTEEKEYLKEEINDLLKVVPLETKVDNMLAQWLQADFEGDEIEDRQKFAKKLVDFMRRELEKQSG